MLDPSLYLKSHVLYFNKLYQYLLSKCLESGPFSLVSSLTQPNPGYFPFSIVLLPNSWLASVFLPFSPLYFVCHRSHGDHFKYRSGCVTPVPSRLIQWESKRLQWPLSPTLTGPSCLLLASPLLTILFLKFSTLLFIEQIAPSMFIPQCFVIALPSAWNSLSRYLCSLFSHILLMSLKVNLCQRNSLTNSWEIETAFYLPTPLFILHFLSSFRICFFKLRQSLHKINCFNDFKVYNLVFFSIITTLNHHYHYNCKHFCHPI